MIYLNKYLIILDWRRASEELTFAANKSKFTLIKKLIDKDTIFVEFAPGDCKFACEVAKYVKFVYGVDISETNFNREIIRSNSAVGAVYL